MLYVNDAHFSRGDFDHYRMIFDKHPVLCRVDRERIAVRVADPAFWIALCLYVKERGGTVFPLPLDTPIDAARRRAARGGCRHLVFGEEGAAALERLEVVSPLETQSFSGEVGLVQMSSGTTGGAKYLERSWSSIDEEIAAYVRHFAVGEELTPIIAAPTNHSYGLISGVLVALARGQKPVIVDNPNPKYILHKLEEQKSTLLYSSPTLIATIAMLAGEKKSIHSVMTSGTTMQKSWFEMVRRRVRHLHQQYGCSEAGCITVGQDIGGAQELGTPLPHAEVMVSKCEAEPSEIVVKTSAGVFIETRDLGYFAGNSLHFVGRLDDTINVSGFNVYPSDVEEVVLEMPGVTDAVVYKRDHGFGTDQVCLEFVSERPVSKQQIRDWCVQKLASYQVPMSIECVETIPRLPNGKVSRRSLAEGVRGRPS